MKKLISITLCLVMVLALASAVFALKPINPGSGFVGGGGLPGFETTEKKAPAKVQAFIDAVDAIGTVTAESGPMIEAAEAAYTAMTTANLWTMYELEYPDFW